MRARVRSAASFTEGQPTKTILHTAINVRGGLDVWSRAAVVQQKTGKPVTFEITTSVMAPIRCVAVDGCSLPPESIEKHSECAQLNGESPRRD